MVKFFKLNKFSLEDIGQFVSKGGADNLIEVEGAYYKNSDDIPTEILLNKT